MSKFITLQGTLTQVGSSELDDYASHRALNVAMRRHKDAVTDTAPRGEKPVPQNVPQQYANQALHARYALHARRFSLSGFVSVENKECLIYFPKLDVAGSIPVARSKFQEANLICPTV
jgi:hypothetical protein